MIVTDSGPAGRNTSASPHASAAMPPAIANPSRTVGRAGRMIPRPQAKAGYKMGGTTRMAIRETHGPPVNRLHGRRLRPLPRPELSVTSCGSRNTTPAPQRSNPMRFAPSLAVVALVACAAPLAAQETPTERSAAVDVVRRMNTLERSLALPGLVARLTGARDPRRDAVLARAKALMDQELLAMADDITRHPETGYKEERSVKILTDYLQAHDFDVTTGVAGLKTAFVARYKKGTPGPNLGVILEYDALRGTTRDFHGVQHTAHGHRVRHARRGNRLAGSEDHDVSSRCVQGRGPAGALAFVHRDPGPRPGLRELLHEHRRSALHLLGRAGAPAAGVGWTGCAHRCDRAVQPHRRHPADAATGDAHSGHHHRGRQGAERGARPRGRGILAALPRSGVSGAGARAGERRGPRRRPRHRDQGPYRGRLRIARWYLGRRPERRRVRVPEAARRDEARGRAGAPPPLRGDRHRRDRDPGCRRDGPQLERRLPHVRDGSRRARSRGPSRLRARRPGDGRGAVPLRHRHSVSRDGATGVRGTQGAVRRVPHGAAERLSPPHGARAGRSLIACAPLSLSR